MFLATTDPSVIRLSDFEMIDSQHLEQYPYCGSMNYIGNKPASSARVVNSKTPKEVYRWIVLQIRLKYKKHESTCGGTIITDRYHNK